MGRMFIGAVALGLGAAVGLAAIESAYVLSSAGASLDGFGELAPFCLEVFALLAAIGILAGALQGAIAIAIERAPLRLRAPLYAAALLPAYVVLVHLLFRGRHAQEIRGHRFIQVAVCALLIAATMVVAGALRSSRRWRQKPLALALVLFAVLAYLADQRVLPRLYPSFHVALELGALGMLELAVYILFSFESSRRRRVAWLAIPLVFVGAAASLHFLARDRVLKAVVLEHAAIAGRTLRAISPSVKAPSSQVLTKNEERTSPVRFGPHLGGINVLLITVDAMRADRLNASVTPELERFVSTGTVFEHAYAQVPHTSFSIATLLTGKFIYSLSTLGLAAEKHESLAQVLKRERYKTAAFYPPAVFYIDHDRLASLEKSAYGFEYVKYEYLNADKRTDQVIRYLEEEKPERTFMWVHYFEPHEPYDLHDGFTRTSQESTTPSAIDRYEGEIRYTDHEISRLLEYLKRTRPHTLVVLTADHGEEFGEHGGRYHGTTLYEEQVRVPLALFMLDGSGIPARHVSQAVGLVDVSPTVLALLGVPPSLKMRGYDLGPLLSEPLANDYVRGAVFGEIDRRKMVVDGTQKLICDFTGDSCELYDLANDHGEKKNLVRDASLYEKLRGELDQWMAQQTQFEDKDDPLMSLLSPAEQTLINRGRQGDRGSVAGLMLLLENEHVEVRREAAQLLSSLALTSADGTRLEKATHDPDRVTSRWAVLARARATERSDDSLETEVRSACQSKLASNARYCARGALVLGNVAQMALAIDRVADADERELEVELAHALGTSHDPLALDPLLAHLSDVRTRREVAEALGELGDVRAIDSLAGPTVHDPYVPVRATLATVMGRLGARASDAGHRRAAEALRALLAEETEAPPALAAIGALGRLRDSHLIALGTSPVPIAQPGSLWVACPTETTLTVRFGNEPRRFEVKDGAARVPIERATRLRIDRGAAPLFAVFSPAQAPTDASSHSR